jgi:flagellar basal-body rod protein FlgG
MQEKRMEILANNMANVNTFGFKGDRPVFKIAAADDGSPPGGAGVDASTAPGNILPLNTLSRMQNNILSFKGVKTDFSQGELRQTGNKLDLALKGSGLFTLSTPQGTRYTRNGNFTLNERGLLVTHEGYPVLGESGPIKLEGEHVTIRRDGAIMVGDAEVDSLKIAETSHSGSLRKVGENQFEATGSPLPTKDAAEVEVIQGFLESSNVNIIKEMVTLIEVSKAYESYQKVVQSLNEALSKSVNEIGRLA